MDTCATDARPFTAHILDLAALFAPWYVTRNLRDAWCVERHTGWHCVVFLTPDRSADEATQAAHARAVAAALNRVYGRAP